MLFWEEKNCAIFVKANDVQAAAQIAEMNKRLGDKDDQLAEAKESIANTQQQLSSVQADYQQAQVQLKQAVKIQNCSRLELYLQ